MILVTDVSISVSLPSALQSKKKFFFLRKNMGVARAWLGLSGSRHSRLLKRGLGLALLRNSPPRPDLLPISGLLPWDSNWGAVEVGDPLN